MQHRLLVAIPALNEEATIASVIAEVRAAVPSCEVLVVDDGSKDDTAFVARGAGARVLQLPFNVGVGGAMRTAFLFASRNGFDCVVQVDADGQHDPRFIPDLLTALADHSVVIGSRFAGSAGYPAKGPRRWAMSLLAWTLSRVTKTKLTDTTSGFRASDARAIELFAENYPADYLGDTVDSLVMASRAGLPIAQVPVEMRVRQGGRPSQNAFWSTMYLGRAMMALMTALARRPTAQ